MRVCTKCEEEKEEDEFYRNNRRRDRLCVYCKDCTKEATKRKKAKSPSEYVALAIRKAKCHARRAGLPFDEDLCVKDVGTPKSCPLLGIGLDYWAPSSLKRPDDLPTLDRIVPELGYTRGNVWVVSWRANRLKCNGTYSEFSRMVANWPECGKLKV